MNEADALDLIREAIWTIIVTSGPAVGGAMLVGIVIALFQALTQIQEMTLTFVPKIIVIFAAAIVAAPLAGAQLRTFTEIVYGHVARGF
jgi:flagellar biosynthetic protein FliQ